ncbi:MAG: hypothetical protein Tsb002_32590 [Wenzhouxiangellaceae bacterium]
MINEGLSNLVPVMAVFIAFWSVYTTKKLWYQANRPIVSADIRQFEGGVGVVVFNLAVCNSGNRPATNIIFSAQDKDLEKILIEDAQKSCVDDIYSIFSGAARVQLLLNGEEAETAFGGYAVDASSNPQCVLKFEAVLPIEISYKDLNGKSYKSNQTLFIRPKDGFGGSVWEKKV